MAHADGGSTPTTQGGADSATGTGGTGGAGSGQDSGGGGGAGLTGGTGGAGGGGEVGGTGGATPGASGNVGTAGAANTDDGGGGGGGGAHGFVGTTLPSSGPFIGGNGGDGGTGGCCSGALIGGYGGGGGAGGYGAVVTGSGGTLPSGTSITGGAGGAGGAQNGFISAPGNAGSGGVGLYFTDATAVVFSSGTVAGGPGGVGGAGAAGGGGAGGVGGAGIVFANAGATFTNSANVFGGSGGTAPNFDGRGGAGLVGSGLTIINNGGTIQGGTNGGGVGQGYGIIFTGGANSVGNTGGVISGGIAIQGGSFAPALSTSAIGTALSLTASNSPITFSTGTQFVVRLSPSLNDSLNTSGPATLTGAVVNAQFSSGTYAARQYTILNATGGFGGTEFSGVVGAPLGFTDSLDYTGNSVILDLQQATLSTASLNGNQANVANAISNFYTNGGTLPPNYLALFGLTGVALSNSLSQLDGEAGTGAEHGAFQLMTEFLDLMLDPWTGGGGGVSGGGANGFAPEQQTDLPPDLALAYARALKKQPSQQQPQNFDQRWSAWGSGFGGASSTEGNAVIGSTNLTASTYGYAAGMDYRVTPDTIYGFALAGGGTNWSLAQNLGGGRSDAFLAGVHAISHAGPLYVSGALAFANHWFTTSRIAALGDELQAKFEGQSYAARAEAGYRYAVLPLVGVTPYAALQVQEFHTPSYSETDLSGGGFGLSYSAMSATDTRSELGARFDDLTVFGAMPLVLRGRLAWAHDWVNNPVLGAVFQVLPGSNFIVNGAAIPHDSALTTAAAELHLNPNWTVMAKFDGEFASSSQTYAGTGTLRYSW